MKHILAALGLVALAAGSFQPFYLKVWRQDVRQLGAYLSELPYRRMPGLRQICLEADRRTRPGDRVLFLARMPDGTDYAFRRAQYLMAGKDVVIAGDADTIVCLPACTARGFRTVWRSDRGAVLQR